MKRYIVAKVLAAILLIALASSAAGANTQNDTAPGGMGGGLAGAGVGNY
jgi:uncharacterized protein YdeI (BOF family)